MSRTDLADRSHDCLPLEASGKEKLIVLGKDYRGRGTLVLIGGLGQWRDLILFPIG